MNTSRLKALRKSSARRVTKATASGSSAFTWKIGACTILPMSGAVRVERASSGLDAVKPTSVVDDDTNGTRPLHNHALWTCSGLNHALPCDRRITVNGDWQHFVAAWLVQTIQTRTHGNR